MEPVIKQLFCLFIENPSSEAFLAVRQQLVSSSAYEPTSGDLTNIEQFLEQDKNQAVLDAFWNSLPNLVLSPRAHLLAAIAHRKLGQEEKAKCEMGIAHLCLQGITSTGDGSRERPFRVLRVSDEYDVLEAMGKKLRMQSLVDNNGTHCDVLALEDGTELVFDIRDHWAKLRTRREPPPAN